MVGKIPKDTLPKSWVTEIHDHTDNTVSFWFGIEDMESECFLMEVSNSFTTEETYRTELLSIIGQMARDLFLTIVFGDDPPETIDYKIDHNIIE